MNTKHEKYSFLIRLYIDFICSVVFVTAQVKTQVFLNYVANHWREGVFQAILIGLMINGQSLDEIGPGRLKRGINSYTGAIIKKNIEVKSKITK